MTTAALLTLLILIVTVVLLVTEWTPPGVTGLLVIVALIVCGVLPSGAAFAGLTNSAVLTVAAMYVISAAVVKTGAAAAMADVLTSGGPAGASGARRSYVLLLLATLGLSGFVNNTPLILIFLPLVLGLAGKMAEAPSRLLIPLSYMSILGGSATLIGTSTNLIVASSLVEVSGGRFGLAMFDFARLGVVVAVAGAICVMLLRRRLLPSRPSLGLLTQQGVAKEYVTEIAITEDDGLEGRTLAELEESEALGEGVRILQVVRGEVIRAPQGDERLRPADLLLVKGDPEAVLALRLAAGRRAERGGTSDTVRGVGLTIFELVVTPASPWRGQRVGALELHDRYDVSVFAVQRHGAHLRDKIEHLSLQPGDVLLLQGTEDSMRRLRVATGVLVVEGVEKLARDTRRAPIAVLALGAFVGLAVTGVVDVPVAAMIAALAVVLTGCISARAAYEAISWDVLFVIAGTLALGTAFVETGLAASAAHALVAVAAPYGVRAVLAVVLVLTALMTQVVSNNATAAVMTPIAYQLGMEMNGADPLPFVMAVAFGANCSFLTPISYNTNLIVYGPGGYRFSDFLRLGAPVSLLVIAIAIVLLPVLY